MSDVEGWTERQVRNDVLVEGVFHRSGGQDATVMIGNISDEGCCVHRACQIGDQIELTLPNVGRFVGQVRWSLGGQSGIRFIERSV